VLCGSEGIMFKRRLFSIGGKGPSKDTNEINIKKLNLIKRAYLFVAKSGHTLCKDADAIYSVGGRRSLIKVFADCEKYDVAKNKWI